jgi:hypothetical protein
MKVSHHQLTELRNAGVIKNYNQRTSPDLYGILVAEFTIGETDITCQSSVDMEGWYGFYVITEWKEYGDVRFPARESDYDQQIESDEGQTPIEKLKSYEN